MPSFFQFYTQPKSPALEHFDIACDGMTTQYSNTRDFVFGYGSIINDESRSSTMDSKAVKHSQQPLVHGEGGNYVGDESMCAFISHRFAKRCWNFRSATGFTALGIELVHHSSRLEQNIGDIKCLEGDFDVCKNWINGVLFPVNSEQLKSFDSRELGYDRVLVPLEMLYVDCQRGCENARRRASNLKATIAIQNDASANSVRIWTYVPDSDHCLPPDEDFPILQTYIDVCVRGCLQWGGQTLALHFLRSTFRWSDCFLNDAPLSRRPWLHRRDYAIVDSCLVQCAEHVKFEDRKHPEEFASLHVSALKAGVWGLPDRNKLFVGRDDFLITLHQQLCPSVGGTTESSRMSIGRVEVVGMGGVGKSQVSVEYAHRHFESTYGFIAFIRAESIASIAADLRRLACDIGILHTTDAQRLDGDGSIRESSNCVADGVLDDEAVAEEIKRRLARCRFRWLLIFDNVEDPDCVDFFLPRGSEVATQGRGHVLVTSRIAHERWVDRDSVLTLHCFGADDSVAFLNMALRERSGSLGNECGGESPMPDSGDLSTDANLEILAARMGHLPLALWTAGVYMRKCDVSSSEYIRRFDGIVTQSIQQGHASGDAIAACFNMTLDKIACESSYSPYVLLCLGYLAPDISKRSVKLLLCAHLATTTPKYNEKLSAERGSQMCNKHVTQLKTLVSEQDSESKRPITVVTGCLILFGLAVVFQWQYVFNSIPKLTHRDLLFFVFGASVSCFFCCIFTAITLLRNDIIPVSPKIVQLDSECGNGISIFHGKPHTVSAACEYPASVQACMAMLDNDTSLSCEADTLWDLMRHFSLLSSLRGPCDDSRVGTVHRLQQAVLRSRTSEVTLPEAECLERCVWLLKLMWTFDETDSSTWDAAGEILEHMQILAKHVLEHIAGGNSGASHRTKLQKNFSRSCALQFAALLTAGGEYASIVLSRFDSAQLLLETSCTMHIYILTPDHGIYTSNFVPFNEISISAIDKIGNGIDEYCCRETIGDSLHMLGKTLRYNGLLEKSEQCLKKALRVRKQLCSPLDREDDFTLVDSELWSEENLIAIVKVADTMYELGVLSMRMHALYTAKSYLTLSLEVICRYKLSIHLEGVGTHTRRLACSREAAALHQLGVLATLERRYEDAEGYLLEALTIMTPPDPAGKDKTSSICRDGGGKASIARAATLQQLGKVELRRGNTVTAHKHLLSSLTTYRQAYGELRSASHVNIATVLHHLGSTAMASKQFERACEYFSDSLAAREKISEESSTGSFDVITALQSLAKAEMECGRLDAAEALFLRAKAALEKSLDELNRNDGQMAKDQFQTSPVSPVKPLEENTLHHPEGNSDKISKDCSNTSVISTSATARQSLIKNLFFCAHSLKGIYSKNERPDLAAQVTKEIRAMKLSQKHQTERSRKHAHSKLTATERRDGQSDQVFEKKEDFTVIELEENAAAIVSCSKGLHLRAHIKVLLSNTLVARKNVRVKCKNLVQILRKLKAEEGESLFLSDTLVGFQEQCSELDVLWHSLEETSGAANDADEVKESCFNFLKNLRFRLAKMKTVESKSISESDSVASADIAELFFQVKDIFKLCDEFRNQLKLIGVCVDDVS